MIPKYVTMKELLTRLPYSRVHIHRLIEQGEFPAPVKLGRARIAFRETDVLRWLKQKEACDGQGD